MPDPPQSPAWRLFIALPVPEPVKDEIRRLQQELRRLAPGDGVRWVRSEQIHLTLVFLGKVDPARRDALVAATREAVSKPRNSRRQEAPFPICNLQSAISNRCEPSHVGCDSFERVSLETSQGCGPFALRATGVGFFPHERRPRVLWVGLQDKAGELSALQEKVKTATAPFAEKPEDRDFSAHLTLARINRLRPAEAQALTGRVRALTGRGLGEWTADRLEVMRSELHPEGSRYSCLAEIVLRDAA
ncbi:MAG: RNA 2',3'-cyclic phosphodiesterase [Verrucomicrobia bacterium]|nr:RNA 2',3'-cyclic phosphodiesterase [Verrucomicrobiota bacterium]